MCETHIFIFLLGSLVRSSSGLHFGVPLRHHFASQESSFVRLSVIEGLQSASKQVALGKALPGGAQAIWTGGGTLQVGLTGAQLPPPGPSPSTEKERKKRVDVYTRKYTLESIP